MLIHFSASVCRCASVCVCLCHELISDALNSIMLLIKMTVLVCYMEHLNVATLPSFLIFLYTEIV